MRFYELDVNGRVVGSYAVDQPGRTLYLLDEPDPFSVPFPMRDGVPGGSWITDTIEQTAFQEMVADKEKAAKATKDIKDAILIENPDTTKWKIEEVVARIKAIETILGIRRNYGSIGGT